MCSSNVLNVRFNQDKSCFSSSMENGLRIYYADPLVEKIHYDVEQIGSVGYCEMLNRTNLFATVSGGLKPKYPNNFVAIYDDIIKKPVVEIKFASEVKAVRLRKDKLVVALCTDIHVFSFPEPLQKLFTIETRPNKRGLCEITPFETAERQYLLFPGHKIGSVQLFDLSRTDVGVSTAPVCINAHKTELSCIAINQQGTRIATASFQGTLIRVWDTLTKCQTVELRRGSDPATIYSIGFSVDSEYLCCSSDKGTVHIFAIKNTSLNKRMSLPNVGLLGKYGESQWALANFTVPPECACICGFDSNNAVLAVCLDGTFHKYIFKEDGSCNRVTYDIFLNVCDDDDDLL